MSFQPIVKAARLLAAVVATAAAAVSLSAQAATNVVSLTADAQWHTFSVDATSAANGGVNWIDLDYTPSGIAGNANDLSFSFTVADQAIFRVVDLFAAGDTYSVNISGSNGTSLSLDTSVVGPHDLSDATLPFAGTGDEAWANALDFSQLQVTLGAGSYTVTGSLLQSVTDGALPLNMTSGAVSITAVPEPSGLSLAVAALAFVVFIFRRRGAN
jgi:hypothetical protein